MSAFFTKLRYVGNEEKLERGPWEWTLVEIETGDQMVREVATFEEARLSAKGARYRYEEAAG